MKSANDSLLIWISSQINDVRINEQWAKMRRMTLDTDIIQKYNSRHQAIVNALRSRDPEHAAVLIKDHSDTARTSLIMTIGT